MTLYHLHKILTATVECFVYGYFFFSGRVEVVELLLTCGADVSLKDSDNKTVLHRAVESKNKNICLAILKLAPSLKDECDKKGNRPVDYATSPELVSLFED